MTISNYPGKLQTIMISGTGEDDFGSFFYKAAKTGYRLLFLYFW